MAYVYEITDKLTGRWYVGSRSSKYSNPSELAVTYFTSSRQLSKLFKADPSRFKTKVLVESDSEYVLKVEASVLKLRDAMNDPMSYNMTNGNQVYSPVKVGNFHAENKTGVCGRSEEQKRQHGKLGGKSALKNRSGIFSLSKEDLSKYGTQGGAKGGKIGGKISGKKHAESGRMLILSSIGGKVGGKVTGSLRYECLDCGFISAPGAIGNHQKKHSHTGKRKVENAA